MVKQLKSKPKGLFLLPIILMITICVFMNMVSADWVEVQPLGDSNQSWRAGDSSLDGSTMLVSNGSRLYLSTNFGNSWTETQPAGNLSKDWRAISVSNDGEILIAGVGGGHTGYLYLSKDSGDSWNALTSLGTKTWFIVDISNGGLDILVGAINGRLYLSKDSGDSWTEQTPTGSVDRSWRSGSLSGNSDKMIVGYSEVYLYNNSTWTNITPNDDQSKYWNLVDISNDGEILIAGQYGGRLYISKDSGDSWTEVKPEGDVDKQWAISAISLDNSKIIVSGDVIYNNWISNDEGLSWTTLNKDSNPNYYIKILKILDDNQTIFIGYLNYRLFVYKTYLNIKNPTPPIYSTMSYDWNGSFIDTDYNSDYTYKYSFGFNDTDSFDDDEIYIDTNLTLDYSQNTIKYFDLDYTPTTDQIGDVNYSFFRVYRYLNGNYDSNYVSWSSDTFTVLENIVFDFNAPEYPDWANLFYPTKNYSGLAHYQDKSFQSGVTTYKYDLGSNETNSLDGNQEYWKTNIDIASTDGNINAYFEHTLSVADKGKTLYAFLTMKRYHNGVFMDSDTEWTNSFDVNYGKFKAQFYDENCGCTLDGNVHLQNSINIPVDENGTVDIWLDQYITTDGEAIDTEVWREVAGVITHTKRKFDYYLYLTRSYDLNVSLLPIDIGANIQFLTKDIDNTLWANKYLMFVKGITDICPQDQQLISTYISETGVSTNKRGIRFSVNKDFYISTFKIEQGTNPVDSWELWNYTLGILIDSGTGLNSTTTTIDTSIPIKFDTNYEYSIVLFNEGGSAKFPYKSSQFTTPINTEYIEYTNGCDNGALACTSNNAYIITDISIMDANNYESFFDNPISEVKKLDSEGKGIFYLMADGNYSAILIDNIGTIIRQYQKTTVNLKKPKDEITGASISPYDVDVGGLLVYSLSNQTATDLNFNIFAGSTGYYDFTVVDYNANPTDRSYIPRKYAVRIPFGIEYTSNYNLQPYLITDVDGIIPQIKVIDQLNRAINDSVVIVYKYINGKYSVVESAITDSTGSMSWSAYPLDSYTIAVYYNEELKGTYILRPRTSDDVYYIKIELSADDELSIPDIFRINWGNTKEFYNVSSVNVTLDDVIISNSKSDITNYTVLLYQGNTLIDSDSNIVDNVNTITINHEFDCTTINKEYSNATIKIIVEYNNGLIKKFTRIVSISGRNVDPLTYFRGASEDLGQPLSAIISIFITALIIAMLSFSGLPLGKSGVALFGMFVLTVFVWFGWLDSGVTVLGFDVSRFMYVLVAIAIAYFTFKESVR